MGRLRRHVDEGSCADVLFLRTQHQFCFPSQEEQHCRHRRGVRRQLLARGESECNNLYRFIVEQSPAQNAVFRYGNLRLDVLEESVRCHIVIVTAAERAHIGRYR